MELLILFAIAAVGAVWWLNYTWQKKAHEEAKAKLDKQETEAPYKVEPTVTPVKEIEVKPVEPLQTAAEPLPVAVTEFTEKVKKPRKPSVKKPVPSAKARVKKTTAKKTTVSSK
jgi:outer membrane biosynthesis protein TonB